MRSTCSGVARRSCTSRSASALNGRPQRFTRKPGPSAARITRLPIASPTSVASDTARSPLWSARITSSSSISGGGLKKCMPTTFSGFAAAPASPVTGIEEVLLASTGVVAADLGEPLEQLALEVAALGRGLDHEVAAGQALELLHRLEQLGRAGVGAALLGPLRQALAHVLRAALERLGHRVVQQRGHPGRAAELRDAGAHRAGAHYAERGHRPWKSGLRFSRNARMPSTRSSVAIASS